jgi:hypothetical protein
MNGCHISGPLPTFHVYDHDMPLSSRRAEQTVISDDSSRRGSPRSRVAVLLRQSSPTTLPQQQPEVTAMWGGGGVWSGQRGAISRLGCLLLVATPLSISETILAHDTPSRNFICFFYHGNESYVHPVGSEQDSRCMCNDFFQADVLYPCIYIVDQQSRFEFQVFSTTD